MCSSPSVFPYEGPLEPCLHVYFPFEGRSGRSQSWEVCWSIWQRWQDIIDSDLMAWSCWHISGTGQVWTYQIHPDVLINTCVLLYSLWKNLCLISLKTWHEQSDLVLSHFFVFFTSVHISLWDRLRCADSVIRIFYRNSTIPAWWLMSQRLSWRMGPFPRTL